MHILSTTALLVVTLCGTVWAEFQPCKFSEPVSIGSADSIRVQRLDIAANDEKSYTTVFLPNDADPVPGVVVTRSEIEGPDRKVDLLRYALAMARAGAAVIVLDGAINWITPTDNPESPHLAACAGQWLLLHARLDRTRLAVAGPLLHWGGGETPHCMKGELPCWLPMLWMNFGQTSSAEFGNTEQMLRDGGLSMARFGQRILKLRPIRPGWFSSATVASK
jgi:hypothetical protein